MGSTKKGLVPDLLRMIKGFSRMASPWESACAFSCLLSSFLASFLSEGSSGIGGAVAQGGEAGDGGGLLTALGVNHLLTPRATPRPITLKVPARREEVRGSLQRRQLHLRGSIRTLRPGYGLSCMEIS